MLIKVVTAVLSIAVFIVIIIVCPVRSEQKADSKYVWTNFVNSSNGWSNGTTFLIGLSGVQFMFCGIDGTIHMAEECREPAKVVPRAILTTIAIGTLTAFLFAISMAYSNPDMASALSSPTG